MKLLIRVILATVVLGLLAQFALAVEATWNYAVQVSAAVQASPAQITLTWPQDTSTTPSSYTVYRKVPGATSWGSGTTLTGATTSYIDVSVTPGTAYEYQVAKNAGTYSGYGYIEAGINVPLVDNRGKLVLIVDNTYAGNLAAELARLQQDLAGDGWVVLRHDVNRTDSVATVKNIIKADYAADPANVKAVFLFGHVPVAYSGQLNPDGHPDHVGAWPADVYYGNMNGSWTDSSVNYTQTVNTDPVDAARLTNVPGDGKFDQTTIPGTVELQVGRVDLANMPGRTTWGGPATFLSEQELLRQYLAKDHNYRAGLMPVQRRAIIGDYFGNRGGEAFSSSAYGAASAFFGANNITNLNVQYNDQQGVWVPALAAGNYLFAYGCGAGSYLTIAGLGNFDASHNTNTVEIVTNNVHGVFNLVFGSWHGDWDHEDNVMRSILCTPTNGLTAAWSGRPHWFMHPMGLGETVGYTARLAQNNTGTYLNQVDGSRNLIHVALMGDPTLRLHVVAPPATLGGTLSGTTAALAWTASPDSVLGYHVYRGASANGPFTRLTSTPQTGLTFTDASSSAGAVYMVRAVKLESSSSGSYYNASQGMFWTVGGSPAQGLDTTAPTVSVSAPANGATVSGSGVTVSATAADNVGVVGVQFKLDGVNLGGEVLAAPFTVTWDSTSAANGPHTLSAVARDLAGNQTSATALNITVSNTAASTAVWFDDALPAGASGSTTGGDTWSWVASNPAPFSGSVAHQTALASGLHEQAFNWASATLPVTIGDKLFTYIYLDPANPPTEIMLSFAGDNWEHRAYWGANTITYGTNGTASRYYVGTLPATGQWVRLEVPASALGLEGQTLTGMSFSLYDGRATWDYTGKSSSSGSTPTGDTTAPTVAIISPASGAAVAGGSVIVTASASDNVGVAGVQFTLDGANLGTEVTAAPYSVSWDSTLATNGTHTLAAVARDAAGNTATATTVSVSVSNVVVDTTAPTVALTAPANGATVSGGSVIVTASASDNVGVAGVQFTLDGANLGAEVTAAPYRVSWDSTLAASGTHTLAAVARDAAGNTATATTVSVSVNNVVTTTTTPPSASVAWVDDALPAGAFTSVTGGDAWTWVTGNPAPFSGTMAHQSNLAPNLHEHSFNGATATMTVATGDILYAYIYLDPANLPTEAMLSWNASGWEHRAFWGADRIKYGTANTASRRSMGALPAAGQWVRLEVPASLVGLEGQTVTGMSFSLYGGRATWDATGSSPALPTVTVAATDATATIGTADNAVVTFTRTGSTAAALTVNYTLSGTAVKWNDYRTTNGDMPVAVTIPAGSSSTTTTIVAVANSTNANPETAVFTLASDPAYLAGTANSATLTLASPVVLQPAGSTTTADNVWFDDALPAGAGGAATGGDAWTWVTASPAPFSGTAAHQSNLAAGVHEHSFNWASPGLAINIGDILVTYVYLDPANPPTELMLSFNGNNWEHRAYWGANTLTYGTDGTASRYHVGALPATGQWVRLEVPASALGLEGQTLTGMSFSLVDGRATWDHTGTATTATTVSATGTPAVQPSVTIAATDATATINSTDNAVVTFSRTGDTSAALNVNYTLGGTAVKWTDYRTTNGDMPVAVTIPAGSASTTMTIVAVANSTSANPETAVFTLANDPAYAVGSASNAALTLAASTTSSGGTTGGTGGTSSGGTGVLLDVASIPVVGDADYLLLEQPIPGDNGLRIVAPTVLELQRINTKASTATTVDSWDFVSSTGALTAPAASKFVVTVNGLPVTVSSVGFKRRPLYAPLATYMLRIENSLYLTLASPIPSGATVVVTNPDTSLWPVTMLFTANAHPLRYSPAIHVNQEGYMPALAKKAAVGYYLGNLGEMDVPASAGFQVVNAATGAVVFTGSLTARPDTGWTYSSTPYQKVYEADFTALTTPGKYYLAVPGLGASVPFKIDDGIAMAFARAYALGLYHQRCGTTNAMPYTRFVHDACHTAPSAVPSPASSFSFTWTCIASYANNLNSNNPVQIAPALTNESAQLYPFVNKGTIDVSGGHHDAGDYSKYTINSASLIHELMFAVDSVPGVAALDNLGTPESGDGISDVMQEAKWEADFLAKMQDADGGFYFLVYPMNREYESNVTPDQGDAQVVWPKNTAASAAATAALAEIASSPAFKAAYPTAAANYLAKAKLGWTFLTNAIAKYGKAGAYQKITHYGDDFTHDDELAWAAAAMFVATGDQTIHTTLKSWFDPSAPANLRWGWWHGYASFGNAERAYAFAATSGRLAASALDSVYLTKCQNEILAAGNDSTTWSGQSAYGTSFPTESKHVQSAGWYFSGVQAFDIAAANALGAKPGYTDAILRNLNYEGGNNPLNLSYVTGLGTKRQHEIVHQYAQNDRRDLPPSGIPLGNIQTGPIYTSTYGTTLASLVFPSDSAASSPYPFYDRWSDTFNVTTEFVHLDTARSLVAYAALAAQTSLKTQAWQPAAGTISGLPATLLAGTPVTATLTAPAGIDLTNACIVWEAAGQPSHCGPSFTFTPSAYGQQWVEAEATLPDGRRVFAVQNFFSDNGKSNVSVVATDAAASISNSSDTAVFTFTRTGDTSQPLVVNYSLTGSAVKWNDYRTPAGDMPTSLTIPAGAASATLTIYAVANTTNANPETVIVTVTPDTTYNAGSPTFAQATLNP